MDTQQAVKAVSDLAVFLHCNRLTTNQAYREWRKTDPDVEGFLEEVFGYVRKDGMPKISTLVAPFFHEEYDGQIGFNYTHVAHNVLHSELSVGWTPVLRQCRGIVIHAPTGKVLAKPFEKFFNHGSCPEATNLPEGPVDTMEKEDGHLAIIYRDHEGRITMTTRGSFKSKTGIIGREMLQQLVEKEWWARLYPEDFTVLAEMIHPETHVIRTYRSKPHFRLIGAIDNRSFRDYGYGDLKLLGLALGLRVAKQVQFASIVELRKHMKDRTMKNREGYVARFADGRRVKFKYEAYLGKMFAEKFGHGYAMRQMLTGKLEEKMRMMDEEIVPVAKAVVKEVSKVKRMKTPLKARWTYLYGLVPKKQQTSSYKATCRKFVQTICK